MPRRPPAIASRSSPCCAKSCPRRARCWKSPAGPASTRCIFAARIPAAHLAAVRPEPGGAAQHRGPCGCRPACQHAAAARARCHSRRTGRSTRADAIVCINMIHISPWRGRGGLDGGRRSGCSRPARRSISMAPIRENGEHTAPSNAAFDASPAGPEPRMGRARPRRGRGARGPARFCAASAGRDAGQQSQRGLPPELTRNPCGMRSARYIRTVLYSFPGETWPTLT